MQWDMRVDGVKLPHSIARIVPPVELTPKQLRCAHLKQGVIFHHENRRLDLGSCAQFSSRRLLQLGPVTHQSVASGGDFRSPKR